jgi:hypothetical protein
VTAGLLASFGVGLQMAAGPLPARFRPTRDEPDEASAAAVASVLAGQESQADEIHRPACGSPRWALAARRSLHAVLLAGETSRNPGGPGDDP